MLNGKSVRDFDLMIAERRREENNRLYERRYQRYQGTHLLDETQRRLGEAKTKLDSDIEQFILEHGREQALALLTARIVALRKGINRERKQAVDRFKNESEMKRWFEEIFKADFYIHAEVPGVHVAENKNVSIDYILFPKEYLIQAGFESCHFGVEVKYFKQESEFTHKTSRGLWQTISYNDCNFAIGNSKIRLKFGLIFSNLSFDDELDLVNNFGLEFENDRTLWNGLLHLANHAKVGYLHIKGSRNNYRGWEMRFVGNSYFTCSIVRQSKIMKKSNEKVINKIRIGNF